MIFTIIGLLLGILIIVVAGYGLVTAVENGHGGMAAGSLVGILFGLVVLLGGLSVQPVDAGYVGVVTSFGKVQPDTLKPGLNFVFPFVNSVTDVDTRVQGVAFDKLAAASKEYQDVFLTGTLQIHVDQNAAVTLYQNVGLDYGDKLVKPFFADAIKEIVPQFAVGDVLANRAVIRQKAVDLLKSKLAPYGIVVDDVALANIDFSDQYKQAVEAKQVAEQNVLTEQQILAQKNIQAQEAAAVANGQAQATLIAAQAQAKANQLLNDSLTPELIQYTGIIKLNPNVSVIYLPEGSNFFLNAPSKTSNP